MATASRKLEGSEAETGNGAALGPVRSLMNTRREKLNTEEKIRLMRNGEVCATGNEAKATPMEFRTLLKGSL